MARDPRNLAHLKETNPFETATSVEIPSKSSRSTETEIVNEKPNQPDSTFVFPKTAFAKQNRSCQAQWFVEYKWLDYNGVNNNVTCFNCKKHLEKLDQEKNKEDAFLHTESRNWEEALTSIRDHEPSKCHLDALTFKVTVPQYGNILEMTSEGHKAKMKKNRQFLIKIIESLQYLGRQALALRGGQSDEDSNFIQLLKLSSKDFSKLKQWLEKKIQNEILMLMAH